MWRRILGEDRCPVAGPEGGAEQNEGERTMRIEQQWWVGESRRMREASGRRMRIECYTIKSIFSRSLSHLFVCLLV